MASLRRIEAHAAECGLIDVLIGEGGGECELAVLDELDAALRLGGELGDLGGIIGGGRNLGGDGSGSGSHECGQRRSWTSQQG